MARSLFWLSDEAWKTLEPHLPHGKPGKPRVDDRTVISGILHVLKTGCRWRDVPPAFGPPTTIYNRSNRWSQRRIWPAQMAQTKEGQSSRSIHSLTPDALSSGQQGLQTQKSRRTHVLQAQELAAHRNPI